MTSSFYQNDPVTSKIVKQQPSLSKTSSQSEESTTEEIIKSDEESVELKNRLRIFDLKTENLCPCAFAVCKIK